MKNYEKIIDQFDMHVRRGIHDDWKLNDKFLKFVLDHSQTPSFQGRKEVKVCKYTGEQSTHDVKVKKDQLSPEQEKELREVLTFMNGWDMQTRVPAGWYAKRELERSQRNYANDDNYVDYARWNSANELRKRITKIPPDMQESILVIAIMIYLLRVHDAEFNSETATFGTFFENWHQLVIGSYDLV